MERRKRSFQEFVAELATTPPFELGLRTDFAFFGTNLIPEELTAEYNQFCSEWKQRFGVKDTIQGITTPGWYNLTIKACAEVTIYDDYPDRLRTTINVWAPDRIAQIRANWEETFPGRGDEATVVARIDVDPRFGPWIAEVSAPMKMGLVLVHHFNGNSWWTLSDHGSAFARGVFSVQIPGPGTIPFQRSARWIETRQSGWYNDTAVILEWIYAAGADNALTAADAALSGRSSETMATARKKVRAAMAKQQ